MKIKRNIVHFWAYQSTKTWKNDEKNSDRHKHNTAYKSRIYIRANGSRKPIIQQRTNKCFYACHYNIFEIICVQLKSRKRNWNRNRTRWVILKQGQLWFLFHSSAHYLTQIRIHWTVTKLVEIRITLIKTSKCK